ncbi:reverse transcriptase domain-containing protein, partial [Bacteroides uniformis]|uniref:reverse transcriptase domain-containing protein n=1 Tax=Bacteroides uniformis TaxID=820 RepID=UPI001AA0DFC1
KMPFGLTIVGTEFQRAMDLAFVGKTNKLVVIYLDDLTVFSNLDQNHLKHFMKVFDRCRKFWISLNPKKSLFAI